jgi:hypothetical protein
MAWAVHRLEAVNFILVLMNKVHVILVFEEVATDLPQFLVVHIRSDDFLVATNAIFVTHECYKPVVDLGAVRIEESTTRSEFAEIEQTLPWTYLCVFTLLELLLFLEVFFQKCLLGE